MKKIYLLSGNTGSGKTTKLREWVNKYKGHISVSGLTAPVINGKRFFEDIGTGETFLLETSDTADSVTVGRYTLSKRSFEKAREILTRKVPGNGWLIIDEFGKLELKDEGLNPVISGIMNSAENLNLLIVIRESLIEDFLKKYSVSDYDIFNYQNPSVAAWILAGGENKRMGMVKALLKFGNETLIERTIKQLKKFYINISISSDSPEKFSFTGLNTVEDIIKGFGPVSGIHSILQYSDKDYNLILTCDMPLFSDALLKYLSDFSSEQVIFRDEKYIHPFPGIYSKEILPLLNSYFESGERKSIYKILSSVNKLKIIDINKETDFSINNFFNMNTPEDYIQALKFLTLRID
jgi:molybdenum cofactor guanylyltransferase